MIMDMMCRKNPWILTSLMYSKIEWPITDGKSVGIVALVMVGIMFTSSNAADSYLVTALANLAIACDGNVATFTNTVNAGLASALSQYNIDALILLSECAASSPSTTSDVTLSGSLSGTDRVVVDPLLPLALNNIITSANYSATNVRVAIEPQRSAGLSEGAKAGIVIGVLCGVLVVIILLVVIFSRKNSEYA